MRRGNTLRESPTDHTADWEPLVLASVGPCRRGRMSSGATQSWPRTTHWANFRSASWVKAAQFSSFSFSLWFSFFGRFLYHKIFGQFTTVVIRWWTWLIQNKASSERSILMALFWRLVALMWTPMRPLAAELPLWQIDICNLREAVTQHPPDGESRRGTQSIKHGLFRNNHFVVGAEDSFEAYWL